MPERSLFTDNLIINLQITFHHFLLTERGYSPFPAVFPVNVFNYLSIASTAPSMESTRKPVFLSMMSSGIDPRL
jgi:hypothetical protein